MHTRVLVWGHGNGYYEIQNQLNLHERVGDLDILAYVDSNFSGGGYIKPEQIKDIPDYEYIIVTTEVYYQEIVSYADRELNIPKTKFLHGKIFKIPYFNWEVYLKIYESNISIIAEACYGGILSHHLGLPFNSPFVNVRIGYENDDYYRMLSNIDKYMQSTPKTTPSGTNFSNKKWTGMEGRIDFPKIWYDDILIQGFHFVNEMQFLETWERRRKRYQNNNTIIFKILYDDRDVQMFQKIRQKNKVGFYHNETEYNNIIRIPFSEDDKLKYAYSYGTYITQLFQSGKILQCIDIFKILRNENG